MGRLLSGKVRRKDEVDRQSHCNPPTRHWSAPAALMLGDDPARIQMSYYNLRALRWILEMKKRKSREATPLAHAADPEDRPAVSALVLCLVSK